MVTKLDAKNEMLKNIFAEVGQKYGYNSVNAEFTAFADFKCRWQRTHEWADFTISDYLVNAPAEILGDLAEILFDKITGGEGEFPQEFKDFVTSEEIHGKWKDTFLLRKMAEEVEDERVQRVAKKYKVGADNITLAVGEQQCVSVLMRTIIIPKKIYKSAPKKVLDYLICRGLLLISNGYLTPNTEFDVNEKLKNFPNAEEIKEYLGTHGVYLN